MFDVFIWTRKTSVIRLVYFHISKFALEDKISVMIRKLSNFLKIIFAFILYFITYIYAFIYYVYALNEIIFIEYV